MSNQPGEPMRISDLCDSAEKMTQEWEAALTGEIAALGDDGTAAWGDHTRVEAQVAQDLKEWVQLQRGEVATTGDSNATKEDKEKIGTAATVLMPRYYRNRYMGSLGVWATAQEEVIEIGIKAMGASAERAALETQFEKSYAAWANKTLIPYDNDWWCSADGVQDRVMDEYIMTGRSLGLPSDEPIDSARYTQGSQGGRDILARLILAHREQLHKEKDLAEGLGNEAHAQACSTYLVRLGDVEEGEVRGSDAESDTLMTWIRDSAFRSANLKTH